MSPKKDSQYEGYNIQRSMGFGGDLSPLNNHVFLFVAQKCIYFCVKIFHQYQNLPEGSRQFGCPKFMALTTESFGGVTFSSFGLDLVMVALP